MNWNTMDGPPPDKKVVLVSDGTQTGIGFRRLFVVGDDSERRWVIIWPINEKKPLIPTKWQELPRS